MPHDLTRWTVSVSKQTDISLRSFLAQRGMKKGGLSKFIEEAVKWRVLDQTMAEARGKFADMPPEELDALLDEAVAATRQAGTPDAGRSVRLVVDTNILISALLSGTSLPAHLIVRPSPGAPAC